MLQLQFKTHSVLLRLAAQGRASRFFWQLRSAATGAASPSNRATTPWMTATKHYNTGNPGISPQLRGIAPTALISHQAQPVSNRESLWVPQEINRRGDRV